MHPRWGLASPDSRRIPWRLSPIEASSQRRAPVITPTTPTSPLGPSRPASALKLGSPRARSDPAAPTERAPPAPTACCRATAPGAACGTDRPGRSTVGHRGPSGFHLTGPGLVDWSKARAQRDRSSPGETPEGMSTRFGRRSSTCRRRIAAPGDGDPHPHGIGPPRNATTGAKRTTPATKNPRFVGRRRPAASRSTSGSAGRWTTAP